MSTTTPPSGGLSLFPNTSNTGNPARTQPRSQTPGPRATTPQAQSRSEAEDPSSSTQASPPRGPRYGSMRRTGSVPGGKRKELPTSSNGRSQSALAGRVSPLDNPRQEDAASDPSTADTPVSGNIGSAVVDVPPRCDTAFSQANTLVQSITAPSRSSIAKPPIVVSQDEAAPSSSTDHPALRSIFPRYNPDLPLDRQDYYPTQASPTHLPRSAISRPLYSPTNLDDQVAPIKSPMSSDSKRWPHRPPEVSVMPSISKTDEMKSLWKVTNGWRAPASEGRVYVMKLTAERDTPVYTLSTSTQPFYNLRLDPTSTSAYVSVQRYDPTKAFKGPTVPPPITTGKDVGLTPRSSPASGGKKDDGAKNWQEVLTTTLEEESRKQPPNDGLVALLYPTAAARMALDRPNDSKTVALAEHECARLVWDVDSRSYYLVHPALALPFCVTVERNSTWSRTEYALEHVESPQHLGRLTLDATGTGWLEVDTSIAAKIDAVYLVDVAVVALLLVAHTDQKLHGMENFEPPPVVGNPNGSLSSKRGSSWMSRAASRLSRLSHGDIERPKETKPAKRSRMEQFELDIESQASDVGKKLDIKDKDTLPAPAHALIKFLTVTFKCFIWAATVAFRALTAVIAGLARCIASDRL